MTLGESPLDARVRADQMLYALGVRFGPATLTPAWEERRSKLAGSALVPSRLFNDSTIWTRFDGDTRELLYGGSMTPGGYVLGQTDVVGTPYEPGQYRRTTRLRDLGEGQYEWAIRDELALGAVTADQLGLLWSALLEAAESADPAAVRATYRSSLPRTTAVLGRLLTLDSMEVARSVGDGTLVTADVTIHPDRMAEIYPDYSRYLRRYVSPARMAVELEGDGGATWLTAVLTDERATVVFRVHEGRLVPLDGSSDPQTADLVLKADLATRIRIFAVGAAGLVGAIALEASEDESSLRLRFQAEPRWHLPPLVERLLRSPLGRPFEGEGIELGFSLLRTGRRTSVVRDYEIVVQESAIVRWLGALGSTAFGDFRGAAEEEYDQFNGELFSALRMDVAGLLR